MVDIPEELKEQLKSKYGWLPLFSPCQTEIVLEDAIVEDQSNCWEWIVKKLGRPIDTLKEVKEMIRSGIPRNICGWTRYYYPRRPQLLALTDHNVILNALQKGQVGLVVYARALNRWCGGSARMRVLKFKFFLPGCWESRDSHADKNDEVIITWATHSNRDGNIEMSLQSEERWRHPVATIKKMVLGPIINVLKKEGTEVETNVINKPEEEIDTEWSSIEVLVHLPPWLLPPEIQQADISEDVGRDSFPSPASPSAEPLVPKNRGRRWPPPRHEEEEEEGREPRWIPPAFHGDEFDWPLVFRFHQRAIESNTDDWPEDKDLTPRLTKGVNKTLVKKVCEVLELGTVDDTLDEIESEPRDASSFSDKYAAATNTAGLESIVASPVFLNL